MKKKQYVEAQRGNSSNLLFGIVFTIAGTKVCLDSSDDDWLQKIIGLLWALIGVALVVQFYYNKYKKKKKRPKLPDILDD